MKLMNTSYSSVIFEAYFGHFPIWFLRPPFWKNQLLLWKEVVCIVFGTLMEYNEYDHFSFAFVSIQFHAYYLTNHWYHHLKINKKNKERERERKRERKRGKQIR